MDVQLEIRKIISDEIARAKGTNPSYSLRAFARKVGVPPSALSEILSGKRDLTKRMASKILDRLCVDPEKMQKLVRPLRNKKSSYGDQGPAPQELVQLNMDHYHVISEWFYFAILSLAETKKFSGTPEWIARRLNISVSEAKVALKRLERLELLERNKKGQLIWTGIHFKTTSDVVNMSLRKSHYQNLELAKASLDLDQVESRDFSSMTMAIDPQKIPEAKTMIKDFRRKLCAFLEGGEKLEVYRLCLQLFPLSRDGEKK